VIVIDGETVITGSFNLAARYTENWQAHAQRSQPYMGRGVCQ
jgi:hypothetical protein